MPRTATHARMPSPEPISGQLPYMKHRRTRIGFAFQVLNWDYQSFPKWIFQNFKRVTWRHYFQAYIFRLFFRGFSMSVFLFKIDSETGFGGQCSFLFTRRRRFHSPTGWLATVATEPNILHFCTRPHPSGFLGNQHLFRKIIPDAQCVVSLQYI